MQAAKPGHSWKELPVPLHWMIWRYKLGAVPGEVRGFR
jgi:hypothetical protein